MNNFNLKEVVERFFRKNKNIFILVAIIVIILLYFIYDMFIYGWGKEDIISQDEEIGSSNVGDDEIGKGEKSVEMKGGSLDEEMSDGDLEAENEENSGDDLVDESGNGAGNNLEEMNKIDDNLSDSLEQKNKIYVYITGEVNNSGVVVLNSGSRIIDAINAAGGTTSKANISKINLVYILDDGMKVNIPNNDDLKENPDFEYVTTGSGDGINIANNGKNNNGNNSTTNSGSNLSNSSNDKKNVNIVNINSATQTEFETLPGIGPSLALKIINYRNENGKFSSVEDIKNVSGIGESKFNALKDFICV